MMQAPGRSANMPTTVTVEPLARHSMLVPLLAAWFVAEWPAWYGSGGQGDVLEDLQAFAASDANLPIGFVAFDEGSPIGAGALKAESIPTHRHLSPWAAAGFVVPARRRQGIGGVLLQAMVVHARALGHPHVYCGTSTAESLLRRSGWSAIKVTRHAGAPLTIFRSAG